MSKLPDKFLEEGLALAKGSVFFGVPMEDYSHDELLAIAAKGWKAYQGIMHDRSMYREFKEDVYRVFPDDEQTHGPQ